MRGIIPLDRYLDELLASGRAYFSRDEALQALGLSPSAFIAAAGRLAKKKRLASPSRGFYLILRPENRVTGAPDPVRWINPLMKYLGLDYRIPVAGGCFPRRLASGGHGIVGDRSKAVAGIRYWSPSGYSLSISPQQPS